ncbi:MAG: hypothetical protein OJF49_000868 [Ktedonobacterales bacterium]|jgi:hypothetical protein|nr:MAG: hypothetical protein OJF49_000868 [Ktedonobacterales bacterium]
MRRTPLSHTLRLLVLFSSLAAGILAGILASVLLLTAPARAYPADTTGYAIVLTSRNGTTFSYGSDNPMMDATLTYPQSAPAPNPNQFFIVVEGQKFADSVGPIGNTLHVFARIPQFPPGQHTAIATYYDAASQTTVQSNPLVFTILRAAPSMDCAAGAFALPGQALTVTMSFENPPVPVDFQDGTYTITFTGPTSLSFANLVPNANDAVTVTAPTPVGVYKLSCHFSGTTDFAPNNAQNTITVSKEHALGSEQLYTNPTTLAPHQSLTFYVVLHAAPGLPTPTGTILIRLGPHYSNSLPIRADGTVLITFQPVPSLGGATQVQISYFGDPYYATAYTTFPLTNPPIPGSGSGGGPASTPNPTHQPTGTPAASPTTTPAGGSVALASTPPATTNATAPTHRPTSNSGIPLPVLLLLLTLTVLGAGAGGARFLLARRRTALTRTPTGS